MRAIPNRHRLKVNPSSAHSPQRYVDRHRWSLLAVVVAIAWIALWPQRFVDTWEFVVLAMIEVAPLIIPGIVVSAWVNASGAGGVIRNAFSGAPLRAILAASALGANELSGIYTEIIGRECWQRSSILVPHATNKRELSEMKRKHKRFSVLFL